jgi:hypothetical protein
MIASQLRRMIRWQKLQRFRARPNFRLIVALTLIARGRCLNSRRDAG